MQLKNFAVNPLVLVFSSELGARRWPSLLSPIFCTNVAPPAMDPQLLELVDQLRRYVTALPCLPHAKPTAIEKTAVPPKQAWEAFRLHIVNVHGASPLVDDLASQLTPDRLAAIVNGFERCTGSYGDAKLPLEDTLAFRMWLLTFLAACLTKW